MNAHLAAFDEMVDRRNADFHDLSKRLAFEVGVPDPPAPSTAPSSIPSSRAASVPATPVEKSKASWPPEDWEQEEEDTLGWLAQCVFRDARASSHPGKQQEIIYSCPNTSVFV